MNSWVPMSIDWILTKFSSINLISVFLMFNGVFSLVNSSYTFSGIIILENNCFNNSVSLICKKTY